jgi:hypothetical protein
LFSLTYGNALSEQKRYNNFRTEILLHDLARLYPDNTKGPLFVKLVNSEGFAPSIYNISISNRMILRLVPRYLDAEGWWATFQSINHYNNHYNFYLQPDDSIGEDGLVHIHDTYYHTIKTDGRGRVLVILK